MRTGDDEPNPVYEVLLLLDDKQKEKFWIDMAKSAFTYEDFESNQLGTRFYFQYGIKINSLPEDQRASAFQSDLNTFFKGIEVENDPKVVAKLANRYRERSDLTRPKPQKIRSANSTPICSNFLNHRPLDVAAAQRKFSFLHIGLLHFYKQRGDYDEPMSDRTTLDPTALQGMTWRWDKNMYDLNHRREALSIAGAGGSRSL